MLPPFSVLTRPERLTFSKVSVQACQPGGDAPHWGFLSAARKEPKTTKGGAFPRLVESTPRYRVSLRPPLFGPWTGGAT